MYKHTFDKLLPYSVLISLMTLYSIPSHAEDIAWVEEPGYILAKANADDVHEMFDMLHTKPSRRKKTQQGPAFARVPSVPAHPKTSPINNVPPAETPALSIKVPMPPVEEKTEDVMTIDPSVYMNAPLENEQVIPEQATNIEIMPAGAPTLDKVEIPSMPMDEPVSILPADSSVTSFPPSGCEMTKSCEERKADARFKAAEDLVTIPLKEPLSPQTQTLLGNIEKGLAKQVKQKEKQRDHKPITIKHGNDATPISIAPEPKEKEKSAVAKSSLYDITIKQVEGPHNSTAKLLQQAYDALLAGQSEAAALLYKQILILHPHHPLANFGLATSYHRQGLLMQAKRLYMTILEKDPYHKGAMNNYLSIIGEESPAEALEELLKLEETNAQYSLIPAQIGMLYARQEKYEESAYYLHHALEMSPDNMAYRYNLAVVFDKMGAPEQAIEHYNTVLQAGLNGDPIPASLESLHERMVFLGQSL